MQLLPHLVWSPSSHAQQVLELHSGSDHVAARCVSGQVLTWGSGKQGQLGRTGARMSDRSLAVIEIFTTPAPMHLPLSLRSKSCSVACGWYSTYVVLENGSVYACGLNNYGQLGFSADRFVYAPKRVSVLSKWRIKTVAAGAHHTLALATNSAVLAFGRSTYGRLGLKLPDLNTDEAVSTASMLHIEGLEGSVQGLAAGDAVSGCFSDQMCGLFLCGSSTSGMLGKGDDEADEAEMTRVKRTKAFNEVKVTQLSFGGQHVAVLGVPTQAS